MNEMKKSDIGKATKNSGKGWREPKDSSGVAPNHSDARKYGYSSHARDKAIRASKGNPTNTLKSKSIDIYKMENNEYVISDAEGNYKRISEDELRGTFNNADDADVLISTLDETGHVVISISEKTEKSIDERIDKESAVIGDVLVMMVPGGKEVTTGTKIITGKTPAEIATKGQDSAYRAFRKGEYGRSLLLTNPYTGIPLLLYERKKKKD